MDRIADRRSFLARLALAGAGAALAPLAWAARPAMALRLDDDPARERLYLSACETRTAHQQLIDELVAQIEGRGDLAPAERAQAVERVEAMSCPICGCPLGAVEPYPARF